MGNRKRRASESEKARQRKRTHANKAKRIRKHNLAHALTPASRSFFEEKVRFHEGLS